VCNAASPKEISLSLDGKKKKKKLTSGKDDNADFLRPHVGVRTDLSSYLMVVEMRT
jgi:hypothetical protein